MLYFNISDTDIDSGLEHLPTEDLKNFRCYVKNRPQSKVTKLAQICDGGIIISEINKKTLTQAQLTIMKENGIDIDKLHEEKEEEINIGNYKTSEQWLKELGAKIDDPAKVAKFVDAQWWLDQNYPKKDRKDITSLVTHGENIFSWPENKKLIGSLRVEGFRNLREFNCGGNFLTNLEIINCPKLKILDVYGNKMTSLELKNLPQLTSLNCDFNQINNFSISNCPRLEALSISNNFLNNLDFLNNIDPKKLTFLNVACNNVRVQDLSALSRFTELEDLMIGNWNEEQMKAGIYNRFVGSLEPLKRIWLN